MHSQKPSIPELYPRQTPYFLFGDRVSLGCLDRLSPHSVSLAGFENVQFCLLGVAGITSLESSEVESPVLNQQTNGFPPPPLQPLQLRRILDNVLSYVRTGWPWLAGRLYEWGGGLGRGERLRWNKACLSFQKEMKALSLVVQETGTEPEARGRWKEAPHLLPSIPEPLLGAFLVKYLLVHLVVS